MRKVLNRQIEPDSLCYNHSIMLLSIVILQTNKPKDATNCLAALSKARLPAETEIFMINNGKHLANDAIDPASYATLPNVKFLDLGKDGYVRGNNIGYAHAKGKYIATVNADITVHPDTIEKMIAHLEAHPDVGIVAPRLIYPDGHEQDSARPFPRPFELVLRRLFHSDGRTESRVTFGDKDYADVDWFVGAMFIMTRACLEKTGGHDKRYYLFMTDVILCRETWKAGMKVHILRDAKTTHNESRLSKGGIVALLRKKTGRAHIRDSLRYFLQYLGKPFPTLSPSAQL